MRAHAGPHKDTLPQKVRACAGIVIVTPAKRHNAAAAIGSLDDGKWCRLVPAAIVLMPGVLMPGVPILGVLLLTYQQIAGTA